MLRFFLPAANPSRPVSSNLTQRIGTGVVGGAIFVGVAYAGGIWFAALVTVIALFAQWELYGFARAVGVRPWRRIGLVGGGVAVGTAHLGAAYFGPTFSGLTVGLLIVIAALPFTKRHEQPLTDLSVTVFGVIYPSGLLGYLIRLRTGPGVPELDAFWLTMAVVAMIWATDTFAYTVGRAIGKRPLAPRVSPKKTWEGALGGVAGALIVAAMFKVFALGDLLAWPHMMAAAAICASIGQLGDLAESRIKRSVNVKDSGRILPGHGGLLDRFDAFLLAVPAVYLYLRFVARIWAY